MIALQILAGVLLVALLVVIYSLPAAACCGRYPNAPPTVKGKHVREIHHGYGGLLALIPYWPVQVIALIPLADDLIQHLIQKFAKKPSQPFAKSPLHRLAAKVGVI